MAALFLYLRVYARPLLASELRKGTSTAKGEGLASCRRRPHPVNQLPVSTIVTALTSGEQKRAPRRQRGYVLIGS